MPQVRRRTAWTRGGHVTKRPAGRCDRTAADSSCPRTPTHEPTNRCFSHSTSCRPFLKRRAPGGDPGAAGDEWDQAAEVKSSSSSSSVVRYRIPLADTVLNSGSPKVRPPARPPGWWACLRRPCLGLRAGAGLFFLIWGRPSVRPCVKPDSDGRIGAVGGACGVNAWLPSPLLTHPTPHPPRTPPSLIFPAPGGALHQGLRGGAAPCRRLPRAGPRRPVSRQDTPARPPGVAGGGGLWALWACMWGRAHLVYVCRPGLPLTPGLPVGHGRRPAARSLPIPDNRDAFTWAKAEADGTIAAPAPAGGAGPPPTPHAVHCLPDLAHPTPHTNRRSWRFLGRASGQSHDLSWGVAKHVADRFGIGEVELEGVDKAQQGYAAYVLCCCMHAWVGR